MVIIFVPNLEMVLRVCCLAPSPIEIIDMTEATPIIIPKAVKNVLNLCDIKLRIAILNKSRISMEFSLEPDLQ